MNVNCDDCSANGISAHWQGSPEAIPIWKVLILCARLVAAAQRGGTAATAGSVALAAHGSSIDFNIV